MRARVRAARQVAGQRAAARLSARSSSRSRRSSWCWRRSARPANSAASRRSSTRRARSTSTSRATRGSSTESVYAEVFLKSVGYALLTTLVCLALAYPLAALIARSAEEVPQPAAAARDPAVLEQLPDPHLRLDDHPRAAGGARARRQRRRSPRSASSRCRCCSARSRCWSASSTCTCRSWCCRCTRTSRSTTRRCSTPRRTSARNAWQRFWRITFPLSLPGVYAGAALVFIPALGIFAIPDILGGPDDSLIGNVIKQQFLETRDWPFGSVLSIVLTVAALLLAGLAAWVGRRNLGTPSSARSCPCVGARSACGSRRRRATRSCTCRSSSSSSTRSTTRG